MTQKICRSDILTKKFLEECFVADFEKGVISWKNRLRSHFPTDRSYKAWNTYYANTIAVAFLEGVGANKLMRKLISST